MNKIILIAALFIVNSTLSFAAADWIRHSVTGIDTRKTTPTSTTLEIIELPYASSLKQTGTLLMIPGFFQNVHSFDLMPEKNISIARYLMKEFGLRIFMLHVRNLGGAGKGKRLNLDDIAIDDIPAAVKWLANKTASKVIVLGHSQGGIMLQASMAGLTRCGNQNCFLKSVALERQDKVKSLAISAGSVAMTNTNPTSTIQILGIIGTGIKPLITIALDRVVVQDCVQNPLFSGFAYLRPWEFLYHRENVSEDAMLALYERTLEASTSGIITQFIDGIRQKGIRARKTWGRGDRYADHLKNINVRLVNLTYEHDLMAEPAKAKKDSFDYIGSVDKKFMVQSNQGHEDFMMVQDLHSAWKAPMSWLLR